MQALISGGVDIVAFGGGASIDAKLTGADTVFVAIPVNKLLLYMVASPDIRRVEDLRASIFQRFVTITIPFINIKCLLWCKCTVSL